MSNEATEIKLAVEIIKPNTAKEYLLCSAGNRNLKDAKINSLRRDLIAGKFRLNGESIIFSDAGVLIDGHHRLTACHMSGRQIESVVVRGVRSESRKTIDMGASRTVGDHLSIDGMKNANHISAIINVLLSLRNGRPRSANPSSSEVYDFIDQYPEIHDAASFASTKAYNRLANMFGSIYFVSSRQSETWKAENFRRVFSTGIPDYEGCPAHYLRERLNKNAIKGHHMPVSELQRLTAWAWEKFRTGAPVKSLKAPETFKLTGWY